MFFCFYSYKFEEKFRFMRVKNFVFVLLFLFNFCVNAQEGFYVTRATKQGWSGGQPRTGYGINYVFSIVTKTNSDNLSINKIWIDSTFYSLDYYTVNNHQVNGEFASNDTLNFRVSYRGYWGAYMPDDFNPTNNFVDPPIEFEGEAVIEYTVFDVKYYFIIKEFEELPYLAYP